MRAFPQFIKALPDLLNIQKDLVVEIAGVDDTFYGPKPKNKKGITTWGIWAKEFLKAKNVESRVKWRGRLEPKKYVNWLQNSDCHVYLTHPFVVSWSYLEALACGAPIITSDIEATKEFWRKDCEIQLVDHRCDNFLSEPVSKIFEAASSIRVDGNLFDDLGLKASLLAWSDVAGIDLHTSD